MSIAKFLKTWDLPTRFPLKYSIQRSCWLVPDFIGVSRQSRAYEFACDRATARGALAFPSHPEDAIGTGPGGFQAAGDRIEVEIAEALAAKGGRIADGPVWLQIGTGGNGHMTSKTLSVVSSRWSAKTTGNQVVQRPRVDSGTGAEARSTYESTQGAETLVTSNFQARLEPRVAA